MPTILDEMEMHAALRAETPQPVFWHMRISPILASAGLPTDQAISLPVFNAAMDKATVSIEDRLTAKMALARSGRLST